MVGMVVTISPSFSLYRMVVLPAASSPTCRDRRAVRQVFHYSSNAFANIRLPTHHEDPHLLLGEEAGKELREGQPHLEVPFSCLNPLFAVHDNLRASSASGGARNGPLGM